MTANKEFWSLIEKTDYCWNWIGPIFNKYGYHIQDRKRWLAHRLSVVEHGRDPEWLDIDHLCRNKVCVNPCHLDIIDKVTHGKRSFPYTRLAVWQGRLEHDLRRGHREDVVEKSLLKLKQAELRVAEMDTFLANRIQEVTQEVLTLNASPVKC